MEVTQRKRPPKHANATTKRELTVQYWVDLGRPPVDGKLLKLMQGQFAEESAGKVMSPASIARLLADAGAELRHPEIIEFDAQWREEQHSTQAAKFDEVAQFVSGNGLNIENAEAFITKLETLRRQFQNEGSDSSLSELRRFAVEARECAQVLAKNRASESAVRAEQSEINAWLKVWLQTPALFGDWLELRRRSKEFGRLFSHGDTESQRTDR